TRRNPPATKVLSGTRVLTTMGGASGEMAAAARLAAPARVAAPGKRGRGLVVAAVAGALAAAAVVALALRGPQQATVRPASVTPPQVEPAGPPPSPPAVPARMRVTVAVTPAQAKLTLDGRAVQPPLLYEGPPD